MTGGIERSRLQLAWSFTTATTEGTTGRMVHIRDETMVELGTTTPEFTITSMDETGDAGNVVAMANEHSAIYCATNWAGMSEDDFPNAISTLQDLSNMATIADRLQQGVLNQVVLGVVGMNYSMPLPRSVDFDTYEAVLIPAYESPLEREQLLSVIQMLWDSGEGAGYVRHIVTDPLRNTEAKDVLMHAAFGDWQVTELSAMIAARTMGVPIHRPVTAEGRSREVDPGWGIETLDYVTDTSALIIWDSGSDPIPLEQLAPRSSRDPHADPRNDVDVRRQKAAFLFEGELIDLCDDQSCTATQAD